MARHMEHKRTSEGRMETLRRRDVRATKYVQRELSADLLTYI